jgi:geranylgeranyl reductase family protein
MSTIHDADVIIAGAGPAGSSAAFELSAKGYRVLILERSVFPRYKVCGAGLTHKILDELPYDLSPVIETRIRSVRFSTQLKDSFIRTSDTPFISCTMREKLDSYMLEQALLQGAKVLFGTPVTGISQQTDCVEVSTAGGTYRCRTLIGADGASGVVARFSGLRKLITLGLAWEAEIRVDMAALSLFSETVMLDWGTLPGGYAWMFPKGDHISVGVGGPARLSKQMMQYYDTFLGMVIESIPVDLSREYTTLSLRSWPIPVKRGARVFHNGRTVITGDAAGLIDPMTGEGIYYAIRSGRIASEVCIDFLEGKSDSLDRYSQRINKELVAELAEAERIKNLFNTVPRKIHHLLRDNERTWRAFGKILRGEKKYGDVRGGLGKWSFSWSLVCFVSKIVYWYRERRIINIK